MHYMRTGKRCADINTYIFGLSQHPRLRNHQLLFFSHAFRFPRFPQSKYAAYKPATGGCAHTFFQLHSSTSREIVIPSFSAGVDARLSGVGVLFAFLMANVIDAGWSSPVARQAHNLKVAGSNPAPATNIFRNCQYIPRTSVRNQSISFTPAPRISAAARNLRRLRLGAPLYRQCGDYYSPEDQGRASIQWADA
jgi:hypothetical protein